MGRLAVLAVALGATATLTACSSHSIVARSPTGAPSSIQLVVTPTPTVTPPPMTVRCPAAAAVESTTGATHVRVAAQVARGLSTCRIRFTPGRSRCSSALVRVATFPQAYVDFHRWVDEQEQNSTSSGRPGLAPQVISVAALGPEVDWVASAHVLQTGRPGRWISVALGCAGRAPANETTLPLARSLAVLASS